MAVAAKPAKKAAPKATAKTTFSAEERAAMKDAARESKRGKDFDGEAELLAKIADMKEPDRLLAQKVHAIIKAAAPELISKTWYGMPAYARGEKTVCFFQSAGKFKARYAMLGFSDQAKLDDGNMWPVYFALTTKLTAADETRIAALVKNAAG